MTDWIDLSRRASVASHQLVGWIFWDPVAIARYTALGVPDGLGYYVASRAAPLAPAGHQAVAAAFYSINPAFIELCIDVAERHTTFDAVYEARNDAVGVGLREHVPEICDGLAAMADALWAAADQLPASGRVLFAAHRDAPRPDDAVVSGWLAVNCIREWRGDTHWALLVAHDIDGVQAGVLHDAHLNYGGWIPTSRGADPEAVAAAIADLETRGLATAGAVNEAGLALREKIERRTDELATRAWRSLGAADTEAFIALVDPVGATLVGRIDATAGPEWMPAVRGRRDG